METRIRVAELTNGGDNARPQLTVPSEALALLGRVHDLDLSSTDPGALRGNHHHLRRREAMVAFPSAAWSLDWDEGLDTAALHPRFDGERAILVPVSPGASDAGA